MKGKRISTLLMCTLVIALGGCNKSGNDSDLTSDMPSSEPVQELEEAVNILNEMTIDPINWDAFRLVEATYGDTNPDGNIDLYEYLMTLDENGHTYGSLIDYYPYPYMMYGKMVFTGGYALNYEEVKSQEVGGEAFDEVIDNETTFDYYLKSIAMDIDSMYKLVVSMYEGYDTSYTYLENKITKGEEIEVVITYSYSYTDPYYGDIVNGIESLTFIASSEGVLKSLFIEDDEIASTVRGEVEGEYGHCLLFERKEQKDITLPEWFDPNAEFYYGYSESATDCTSATQAANEIKDLSLDASSWGSYEINYMHGLDYQVGSKEQKVDPETGMLTDGYDISEDYRRYMYDVTYTYYLSKDEQGYTRGRCNSYYSYINDEYDQSETVYEQPRYAYSKGYRYQQDSEDVQICDENGSSFYEDNLNSFLQTIQKAVDYFSDSSNYEGNNWSAIIREGTVKAGNYHTKSVSYEIEKDNGDDMQLSLIYDRFEVLDSVLLYQIEYGENYYKRSQIIITYLDPYDAGLPSWFEGSWY